MRIDNSKVYFEVFRYQILPSTQNVQGNIFKRFRTIDELKKRKNKIFEQILNKISSLTYREARLNCKIDLNDAPWFVLEINTQKSVPIESEDFKKERIDSWPHVTVIINNDPEVQLIAISRNKKAFTSGKVVAEILKDNFQDALNEYCLDLQVEALFKKKAFWDLIDKYEGKVASVKFELISPNMSNISKSLQLDLRQLKLDTNSHRTDLKLNSGKDSVLEINRKSEYIHSLVDYSADGGGDIEIRLKGIKKTMKTSEGVRELIIDEVVATNPTPATLQQIFDQLK